MRQPTHANRRLLIVDDNQSIHDDVRAILGGTAPTDAAMANEEEALFGTPIDSVPEPVFEIDSAFQGDEAVAMVRLAQAQDRPYAVAFVDVRMPPGPDGVATIEKLWQIAPDLEVVICTAYSDHDWQSIIAALGTTHQLLILKKPYDNIEVKQMAMALSEKWNLGQQIRARHLDLEHQVAERTRGLEQINQELEQFAYVVSHDLKAPLRGIQTLADWIVSDHGDKLGTEGTEQMTLLKSRTTRMHDLIDGILQYSRVGRIDGEKTPVDLHHLISDITEALAPPDHVTITVDSQLPTLYIEQIRIYQVFQNLISNAIKHCDKPKIKIHVSAKEQQACWQFSIADNGCGIDKRYFEKIFQLFQKLTGVDDYESTGLGLTLVKKIVEHYGGSIWLESTVGKGSTFFFTLPKILDEMPLEPNPVRPNFCVVR